MNLRSGNQQESIFICYAHEDMEWKERLLEKLPKTLTVWHDGKINPGKQWLEEIDEALANAGAAVLLVSRSFFASKFIRDHELPFILRANVQHGVTPLWLPISRTRYEKSKLGSYAALLDPSKPLDEFAEEAVDAELKKAADKVDASVRARRVLVAGSMETGKIDPKLYKNYCNRLGKALARESYTIVAGSHRKTTADHHVLHGADRAGVKPVKLIRVGTEVGFRPDDGTEFKNLLEIDFFSLASGLEARPQQVSNADVVVLLGGGSGTADVAYEAAWQHRPVIPATALGGTAEEWRKPLERGLLRRGATEAEVRALGGHSSVAAIMTLVRRLTPERVS